MRSLYSALRTNVRFLIVLMPFGLAACAGPTSLAVARDECPGRSMLVCESFADERRCTCAAERGLRGPLAGFEHAASFGP
jgi:hypothetical protein